MNCRLTPIALITVLGVAAGCGEAEQVQQSTAGAMQLAAYPAMLHGVVTTVDGETYRGRLRFGGDQEAFWGDYFNGRKDTNPWIAHMPEGERPSTGIRLIGMRIGGDGAAIIRPFMARLGDIAKLEARGSDLWVTMKSGTVHHLDRYAADDYADGVVIRDATHGVVELSERRIRTIEFQAPAPTTSEAPYRLHGTVHTREGAFTGFIQWGPEGSLAMDPLRGETIDGEQVSMPFATVRSIARVSPESARITLLDGSELVLSESRHIGSRNRGIYVDDARYGRVLVSWNALDHATFTPAGAAVASINPTYDDFPPGRPLAGSVVTRTGRTFSGRIVFDLDESEVTETLDAPAAGVDYTLPFELVQSIALTGSGREVAVTLRGGERLMLEPAGDLGPDNGGLLVFAGGGAGAQYVAWRDVARIDFRASPVE